MRFLFNLLLLLLLAVVLGVWVLLPWPGAVLLALAIAAWLPFTRRGRPAGWVPRGGIRALRRGIGRSAAIGGGVAGVVGVFLALLAMAEGYRETRKKPGSADTA